MESMLAEQHYLRSPLRPFGELELAHNNNLTLEEKALLVARSQLFLRATAAAAGPYGPLMNPMSSLYANAGTGPGGSGPAGMHPGVPPGVLWSQWACLGPSLLAAHQQQLAAAALQQQHQQHQQQVSSQSQMSGLSRPLYPSPTTPLQHHRFAPYVLGGNHSRNSSRASPSSPDSARDSATDLSPHSPT